MIVYKDMSFCAYEFCPVRTCHRHLDNIPWKELPKGMGVSAAKLWGSEPDCPATEPMVMLHILTEEKLKNE